MKLRVTLAAALGLGLASICGCLPGPTGTGKVVLPPEVAGTWQARESQWKLVLSRYGTVSSMRVPICVAELKPNHTTKVEMKHGEFSTFTVGDCEVEYIPETRDLYVRIEMRNIHIVFPGDALEGHTTDRFVGPVSKDGKVWTAEWINVFDYGPRFPQDPNYIYPEPLVFDKIED